MRPDEGPLLLEARGGEEEAVAVDRGESVALGGGKAGGGGAARRILEEERALGVVRVKARQVAFEGGAHAAASRPARPAASAVRARSSSLRISSKGG